MVKVNTATRRRKNRITARERSESVADQITLRYDQEGWAYDTASGLPIKSNTAELDHKTNKDGWLWAEVATAATTASTVETTPSMYSIVGLEEPPGIRSMDFKAAINNLGQV